MIVDIDELIEQEGIRKIINSADLDEITFYKDGEYYHIPQPILDDWKFVGMNNIDLITSGFYKSGFKDTDG